MDLSDDDRELLDIVMQLDPTVGFTSEDAGTDDDGMQGLVGAGLVHRPMFRYFVTPAGVAEANGSGVL